jgi:predicted nucleotidyltransferase
MEGLSLTKEDILDFLKKNRSYLAKKFGVHSIALFGSYANGEANEDSDIDLMVDMNPSFENFFELKYYLQEHLKKEIDLVKKGNIRVYIHKKIEDEMIYA